MAIYVVEENFKTFHQGEQIDTRVLKYVGHDIDKAMSITPYFHGGHISISIWNKEVWKGSIFNFTGSEWRILNKASHDMMKLIPKRLHSIIKD